MNPSRTFILRPVATSLLMVGVLLAGIVAFEQLPVSALPEVDYPTIQVATTYPGASPDVVASSVTAPLERQFGQMPGLQQMTSTSSSGLSILTLQFDLELSIDVAEQEVQQAINGAGTFLPVDLPTPPLYSKVNPADTPILTLALTSDSLPLAKVEDLADTRLAPKIAQLPGVGLVTIGGGQKPAVRIQSNPAALASYGLNLDDLRTVLVATNVNQAKGSFDGPHQNYQIGANDQLLSSSDYASLIVAYKNGAPVKLIDVADVVDGIEDVRQAAWMNMTPAVLLNVQRQPSAIFISVVDRIKTLLPTLTDTLPASIHVAVLTDRTTTIRASVEDVEFALMLTIALVVMVMFLFLRTLPATIIPSVAVPLSLVGAFGAMYALGYSLNNLTLMALTISTGFVVDDAIVMVENISRYIERGDKPLDAALKGSEQIGFTIVSLTISLIAVLIPLLFMGDIVGRLFREFAVTLAATILISAAVSLTLTPMMAAKLLKHTPPEKQGRFYRWSEQMFERVIAAYGRTLDIVLDHQTTTMLVFAATLALTVVLFIFVPKGFFPIQDTGVIQGISVGAQTDSFAQMTALQQQAAHVILSDPAVESLSSFVGIDQSNTTLNNGRVLINLKPRNARDRSATEVISRQQPELAKLPGMALYMQPVQDLTVEDRVSRTQFQYTLEDPNLDELNAWAPKMLTRLQQLPELADVASDQQALGLRAQLVFDRETGSRLGITPAMIDQTLYDAYGQRQVSTMFTQLNQYHVILETQPQFQQKPADLSDLFIRSGTSGSASAPATASVWQQRRRSCGWRHIDQRRERAGVVGLLGKRVVRSERRRRRVQRRTRSGIGGVSQRQSDSAAKLHPHRVDHGADHHQPSRPVSGGDAVVQSRAFGVTWRGGQGGRAGENRPADADQHSRPVPGLGCGVRELAHQRVDPHPRGRRHGVHRARRAVRELHPSAHDPLDAPVGRGRRPAVPHPHAHRFRRHLPHRPRSPHRHRQEERDHDDRLRARSGAGRAQGAARCDSRSQPAPLPPHHDDHDGGAARRLAARARLGNRIGAAAPARHRDRRRPAGEPGVDALHNPGDLPLVRSPCSSRRETRMNISEGFIRRPVATALLMVGIALAGIAAFQLLPIAPLPQVDFPTISVSASLPGASPETMASSVATPLERQFGRIAAVTEMTSSSSLGSTSITLQFELDRDIDAAARDVQAAINAARGYLPTNLPANPGYRKVNPADSPIMILALSSATLSNAQMCDAASTLIAQKLAQVHGVGQVTVGGGSLPAVRVELNPTMMSKYGIGLEQTRVAIAGTNANLPKGQVSDGVSTWQIGANDQMLNAVDYAPLLIAYRNGSAVRISDVGHAVDSLEDIRTAGYVDGEPCVMVIVFRQPGANIIDTVDNIRAALPQLTSAISRAINLRVVMDQTVTIRASVSEVERTLLISIGLVVLVVFAFLRSPRTAIIPSVAVPLSLVGTLGVMYLLGVQPRQSLADGADDLDRLRRGRCDCGDREHHALHGAGADTVRRRTARRQGDRLHGADDQHLAGRRLHSAAADERHRRPAVPRVCRHDGCGDRHLDGDLADRHADDVRLSAQGQREARPLLQHERARVHGDRRCVRPDADSRACRSSSPITGFRGAHRRHRIDQRKFSFIRVPKGFFPQQDTGRTAARFRLDQDSSFPATNAILLKMLDIVKADPAVENVVGFTGGGGTTNTARLFIALKPLEERHIVADGIIARLRPKLARVPGATLFLQASQDVRVGGRQSNAQYQFAMQGDDLDELTAFAPRMLAEMRTTSLITDVNSDEQNHGLQSLVQYNRADAARYGISPQLVDATLYDAFGQRQVSTMAMGAVNPVSRDHGGGAGILAERGRAPGRLRAVARRQRGAAQRVRPGGVRDGAACRDAPGPFPGGHAVVQSRAWRGAWRCGGRY